MRTALAAVLLTAPLFIGTHQATAQAPKREALVERVKKAIDNGVRYLRENQRVDGSWEIDVPSVAMKGGWTCLATLSLLNAGVPLDDPMVRRGLEQVRQMQPNTVYVKALQTMVLAEAKQPSDKETVKKNVDWLIAARVIRNGALQGWSYGSGDTPTTDNSNTQYALLGLLAGRQAGIEIPRDVWESIRVYYTRTQLPPAGEQGGWPYSIGGSPRGPGIAMTMTTAGLCGLLIAGMELNPGRETLAPNGPALGCGTYSENVPATRALAYIRRNFSIEQPKHTFYHLYGLERAGRLSGERFFGSHDWYREGCVYLVEEQRGDGSWRINRDTDQWPLVSTSFALLFLSKGRTPVLISKLVHGAWPRDDADTDWNNDRNDCRHLTAFVSTNLFKELPLAWQTFDIRRPLARAPAPTEELLDEITAELLQSPVLYLNGHKSPFLRIGDAEKDILKRYIDNGGFIVAEACCGSAEFDRGFRKLVEELWPEHELKPLPAEHLIWRAHYPVAPGSFELHGLQRGCKTVMVYAPKDLSCRWESNKLDDGEVQLAFRTGANIIAYATGMEPPRPRLTPVPVITKEAPQPSKRGYLTVAQLQHEGDWQPAPQAMRNLMAHLRTFAAVDVVLETKAFPLTSNNLIDYKLLYMHGRKAFTTNADNLKDLRFNLEAGGLLLADACCGSPAFDASFRTLMQQLFPKHKLEPVPLDDDLYCKELNGEVLSERNIRLRREKNQELRPATPQMEGIKIDKRWVVLYSKYDLGCALERHQSPDCLGYDHASALRLGSAAALYMLTPELVRPKQ